MTSSFRVARETHPNSYALPTGGTSLVWRRDLSRWDPQLPDGRDFGNPDTGPNPKQAVLTRDREGYIGAFGPTENGLGERTALAPASVYDPQQQGMMRTSPSLQGEVTAILMARSRASVGCGIFSASASMC